MLVIIEPPVKESYAPLVDAVYTHFADNIKVKISEVDVTGDFDAFNEELKAYSPTKRNNVTILIGSHYRETSPNSPEFRNAEYAVQQKGGLVWGDTAGHQDYETYAGGLEVASRVVMDAQYAEDRARLHKKEGKGLVSRSYSDPHTILVGVGLGYPNLTAQNRYLLGSFPSEWWQGVGFTRGTNAEQLEDLVYWFDSTNFVAIGEKAAKSLESAGYENPGIAPEIKEVYKKDTRNRYGVLVRNLATHPDNALDWRP